MDYDKLLEEAERERNDLDVKYHASGVVIEKLAQAVRELRQCVEARDILLNNTPTITQLRKLEQQNAELREKGQAELEGAWRELRRVEQLRAELEQQNAELRAKLERAKENLQGLHPGANDVDWLRTVIARSLAAIEQK